MLILKCIIYSDYFKHTHTVRARILQIKGARFGSQPGHLTSLRLITIYFLGHSLTSAESRTTVISNRRKIVHLVLVNRFGGQPCE